jgi:predicted DNA-binding transcriptional regulator YafY
MVESAAKRAIRLLDLVPFLTTHQGVTVQEVADEFGISVTDVMKDLDLITMCGLPGYTPLELIELSREDGIITVRDPQNLDSPRRFNEEEVLLLQIALAALEDELPNNRKGAVATLRGKVRSAFQSEIPEGAFIYRGDKAADHLRIIETAVADNLKLEIKYLNKAKDAETIRVITPIRILPESRRTLIDAWCDVANARRTFNLSQIQSVKLLAEPGVSVQTEDEDSVTKVVLSISANSDFVRENSSQLNEITPSRYMINIFQEEWLIRSVLASHGLVKVLEPKELGSRISRVARDALANYA